MVRRSTGNDAHALPRRLDPDMVDVTYSSAATVELRHGRRRPGVRVCGMYLGGSWQILVGTGIREPGRLTDRVRELGEDADVWNGTNEHDHNSWSARRQSDRGVDADIL
jgi:hypothetical protein